MAIEISDNALSEVRRMMAKEQVNAAGMRVGVRGGGCSGLSYNVAFESQSRTGEKVFERKVHELSRKYHPDYFTTAPPQERQQALQMTATLNDAYRTLRHPVQRVEYLVELEGFKADGSKVPKSFLMEVFEINEQIEE